MGPRAVIDSDLLSREELCEGAAAEEDRELIGLRWEVGQNHVEDFVRELLDRGVAFGATATHLSGG